MTEGSTGTELAEILEEVRRIEVLGRRQVTDVMAGGYHSVFRGSGIEFEDVREYAEGDDARSVDWSVTARMGRPFVRRYVDERERTVLFLVDLSPSMAGGFGPRSARGTAARVCACLALSAARNNDRTGFLGFGPGIETWVPPRRGPGHVLRIVRDCLALPSPPGRTDMVPALEFALRGVRRHAVVFLVSDFLADGWADALSRCARRHDVVAVRLLLPERELPTSGLLRVRDPESGREEILDAGDARTRAAWAERLAAWDARTRDDLRRARVDLMDVPVPRARGRDSVTGPILRFFRMRELRGRDGEADRRDPRPARRGVRRRRPRGPGPGGADRGGSGGGRSGEGIPPRRRADLRSGSRPGPLERRVVVPARAPGDRHRAAGTRPARRGDAALRRLRLRPGRRPRSRPDAGGRAPRRRAGPLGRGERVPPSREGLPRSEGARARGTPRGGARGPGGRGTVARARGGRGGRRAPRPPPASANDGDPGAGGVRPPHPPEARALRRLRALRDRLPGGPAEVDPWYGEAAEILRRFLAERHGLRTAERTTQEILADPGTGRAVGETGLRAAEEVLRRCDLVKFARHVPESSAAERTLAAAEAVVAGAP